MSPRSAFYSLLALTTVVAAASADEPKKPAAKLPAVITPTDYLVLPAVGQYGRLPLQRDAVEAQLVTGTWKDPAAGQTVKAPDGKVSMWSAVKAGDDGTLDTQKLRGGYAFTSFDAPAERVMMLEAAGHAMVYVNGEPHAGDPYGAGWLRLPVLVKKGQNTLLFHLGADKLKARLVAAPDNSILIDEQDRTLPTLVRDEKKPGWVWGAVPIINATRDWIDNAKIECQLKNGEARSTPVGPLAPLSVRKVAFEIPTSGDDANAEPHFKIRFMAPEGSRKEAKDNKGDKTLAEAEIVLKRVGPHDIQIRTFRSKIDGSVQPYALRLAAETPAAAAPQPADSEKAAPGEAPGLIVTLHGAGTSCGDHIAQCARQAVGTYSGPAGSPPLWIRLGRVVSR